jgi:hypothetical protein
MCVLVTGMAPSRLVALLAITSGLDVGVGIDLCPGGVSVVLFCGMWVLVTGMAPSRLVALRTATACGLDVGLGIVLCPRCICCFVIQHVFLGNWHGSIKTSGTACNNKWTGRRGGFRYISRGCICCSVFQNVCVGNWHGSIMTSGTACNSKWTGRRGGYRSMSRVYLLFCFVACGCW